MLLKKLNSPYLRDFFKDISYLFHLNLDTFYIHLSLPISHKVDYCIFLKLLRAFKKLKFACVRNSISKKIFFSVYKYFQKNFIK